MTGTPNDWDVVVIGAGAAGLLAATQAAKRYARVLLLEKNRKPGVKILMSGGTRCNLTQATNTRGIVDAFGNSGRFLYSALASLPPEDLVQLFESNGVPTKVESTGKIFPRSDKAMDVLLALKRMLRESGATLATEEPVHEVETDGNEFIVVTPERRLRARRVIVTTGGQSYPGSGTTGDGYLWMRELGHSIIHPRPALVPLKIKESWVKELKGTTIDDVRLELRVVEESDTSLLLATQRGSFLFTHFGVSGPAPMDISRIVTENLGRKSMVLRVDFLPETGPEELSNLITAGSGKKLVTGVLSQLCTRRLAEASVRQAGVAAERTIADLTRAERLNIVRALKSTDLTVTGTLGFKKAEVTAGGVSLAEVDSRTMESKLVRGLYLAGEILDLDGPIGGFNFQAAFSTGWLAGMSC